MKYGHCQNCGLQVALIEAWHVPPHNMLGTNESCAAFGENPAELSRYYVETINDMDLRRDADRWRKISAKYFGKPLD